MKDLRNARQYLENFFKIQLRSKLTHTFSKTSFILDEVWDAVKHKNRLVRQISF